MKIIKEGNLLKLYEYRLAKGEILHLTCQKYGCIFEFDRLTDKCEEDQREGSRWCKCPYCKNNVDFKEK